MQSKEFRLCDVLSITTHRMLSPEGSTAGLRSVLEFLCGEELFVTDLVRVADEMTPRILRQHPAFAELDPAGIIDEATAMAWLDAQERRFGKTVTLTPEHQFHEVLPFRLVPLRSAGRSK